jgi:hypothetical protein
VSAWDDPALTGALGDRIADDLRDMIRAYEDSRERSVQTHIGPSQIGNPCTRCLARHVLGITVTRDFDDPWCAIIGTAVHAWLDEAAVHWNVSRDTARWFPEQRVQPDIDLLPSGGRADLYDSELFTVIDHKVVGAAPQKSFKANGPGPAYRRQGHLYGLGYTLAGHRVDHVAIAFHLRGGRLSDLYVWTEPYDEAIAREALARFQIIRGQALALGPAILPNLPADPDCWDCGGKDVTGEELAAYNPATITPIPA